MSDLDPRALEAAAIAVKVALQKHDYFPTEEIEEEITRAAVTAYFQSAPPEIRIGQFVIRHAGDRIWIGRPGGEGGEFAAADVEAALAQFYRANF